MKIYLDNGATTKTAPEVFETMKPYFTEKYGNASSLHKLGKESKKALENSRNIIAKKVNVLPEEIIFTSGGSESNNLAIKGIAFALGKGHIITTKIEHKSTIETCRFLEKQGFKITWLNVNKHGSVDLKQLETSIRPSTILVSIIHANNEIGTIQDIEKISKICKKHNIPLHIDAVQSFTKTNFDVKKLGVTMASFSAHKIHGPKGVGALYIKKGTKTIPLISGGDQEKFLRAGTENIPGIVGFAKAVQLSKLSDIKKMQKLRDYFIKNALKNIPNSKLNGHPNKRLCNNINISFNFVEGESVIQMLDDSGIAASTGSACSSHSLEPSHVLLAIGLPHEICHGTLRFTLSKYTKKHEIDYTIKKLTKIIKRLRQISSIV